MQNEKASPKGEQMVENVDLPAEFIYTREAPTILIDGFQGFALGKDGLARTNAFTERLKPGTVSMSVERLMAAQFVIPITALSSIARFFETAAQAAQQQVVEAGAVKKE